METRRGPMPFSSGSAAKGESPTTPTAETQDQRWEMIPAVLRTWGKEKEGGVGHGGGMGGQD